MGPLGASARLTAEQLFCAAAVRRKSAQGTQLDKNLGGVLSIWDWLFGPLYVPKGEEHLEFGLVAGEHRNYTSVTRLYVVPLLKCGKLFLRPFQRTEADNGRKLIGS